MSSERVVTAMKKSFEILKNRKKMISLFVLALMIVSAAFLAGWIEEGEYNHSPAAGLLLVAVGMLLFFLLYVLFVILRAHVSRARKAVSISKLFLISFAVITLSWLFCLLVFFPGLGMNDSLIIMMNGLHMSTQHPMLYCAFVSVCTWVGLGIGSLTAAAVIYSVLQLIFVSGCCSVCIIWLGMKKVPTFMVALAVCFYAFCPFLAMYSVTMIKDVIFSALLMLWIPCLYEVLVSEEKRILTSKQSVVLLVILSLGTILWRNNGIFITIPLLTIIMIKSKYLRKPLAGGILLIAVVSALPSVVMASRDKEPLFQESAAIPIQQIAAVIYYDGVIGDAEKEFINEIMPLESVKDKYNPYTVDPIKWGTFNREYLSQNKAEFLYTWLKLFKDNKAIYAKAYLQTTFGFWSPLHHSSGTLPSLADVATGDETLERFIADKGLCSSSVLPESISGQLKNLYRATAVFIGEGQCFWLILLIGEMLYWLFGKRILWICVPLILLWLTLMVSVPVAYSFRYVLAYPFCMPLLLGLCFKGDMTDRRLLDEHSRK